jgi:hypothetical protein
MGEIADIGYLNVSWQPLQRLKYCRCFSHCYESKCCQQHRNFDSFASASDLGDKLSQEGAFPRNQLSRRFLARQNNKGENHGQ